MKLKFSIGSSVVPKMNIGPTVIEQPGYDENAVHSTMIRNAYTCTQSEYDVMKLAGTLDETGLYFIVEEDEEE